MTNDTAEANGKTECCDAPLERRTDRLGWFCSECKEEVHIIKVGGRR